MRTNDHTANSTTGQDLLLVEGDSLLADLTSFRLELLGYQLRVVSSAAEAQAQIDERKPDLLIVDNVLSDSDGIEFVSRLRSEFTPDVLPILVFSVDPSLETVERAFAAGGQAYLVKPFDPTVLEEKIRFLLSRKRMLVKG